MGLDSDGTYDYYDAALLSATDYYPFGMDMPGRTFSAAASKYRYGFNGKEQDTDGEWGGLTHYDYGFRIYNPGIAKFLSVDPLASSFAHYSPYQFAGNSPIKYSDMQGAFKFDPETLRMLREKFPTSYKYLVEAKVIQPGNILELADNDFVVNTMVRNTRLFQSQEWLKIYQETGAGKEYLLRAADNLSQNATDGSLELNKKAIVEAFTSGNGPFIEIRDEPGTLAYGAGGFNEGEDGTNFSTPIHLNTALFEAVESANTPEEQQAALLGLTSVLLHEFQEDFGQDSENYGNGDFGARPLQQQLHTSSINGLSVYGDDGKIDLQTYLIEAVQLLRKINSEGTDDQKSTVPTVPK